MSSPQLLGVGLGATTRVAEGACIVMVLECPDCGGGYMST